MTWFERGHKVDVVDVADAAGKAGLRERLGERVRKLERVATTAVIAQQRAQANERRRREVLIEGTRAQRQAAELGQLVRRDRQVEVTGHGVREFGSRDLVPKYESDEEREARHAEALRRERAEAAEKEAHDQTAGLTEAQQLQADWTAELERIEAHRRNVRLEATARGDEPPRFEALPPTPPEWFGKKDGQVTYRESVNADRVERNPDGTYNLRSDMDLLTGRAPAPTALSPEQQFANA
jgi:hypothetical protein